MASDAWLDLEGEKSVTLALPATTVVPTSLPERAALVTQCWARLTTAQRKFLNALSENRMNARAANRALGRKSYTNSAHTQWMHERDYATIVAVWRNDAANAASDRDRLLARQDDIVETLLTPKPILHQGIPVMHDGEMLEEVEAGAASRANEVLMKAAGVLREKDIEVNVGVVLQGPPTLQIQVMPAPVEKTAQNQSVVIDAKFSEVPSDDEWLET